jgi:hypothetical protein
VAIAVERQRKLATGLIWLGVLAWAPFLYFVAARVEVSIFPFLALHLTGVLGGLWLRARAGRLESVTPAGEVFGRQRILLSKLMIYAGLLAWAPYFYLTRVLSQEQSIAPFLTAHLTGVLGGSALRASVEVQRYLQRRDG